MINRLESEGMAAEFIIKAAKACVNGGAWSTMNMLSVLESAGVSKECMGAFEWYVHHDDRAFPLELKDI